MSFYMTFIKLNKKAWNRGVKRHGKRAMILGLVTIPIWLPLRLILVLMVMTFQKVGDLGDYLSNQFL